LGPRRLGSDHILVVHSDDGLDEISLASRAAQAWDSCVSGGEILYALGKPWAQAKGIVF